MVRDKKIFEILKQEKCDLRVSTPQFRLAKIVWKEAQKELIQDYIENPKDIPLSIKQAVESLDGK